MVNRRQAAAHDLQQGKHSGSGGDARRPDVYSAAGSTPGKRADLIMISTGGLNMGVFTGPRPHDVESTQPENVDTVVVDGRILKSAAG